MAENEIGNRRETEKYDWSSMIQTVDNQSYFSVSLRVAKPPDFQTFLLIKILLNSGADLEDFLLISPDSQYFGRFNFSDILNQ